VIDKVFTTLLHRSSRICRATYTHGVKEVSSFDVLLDDIEQIRQKLSLKNWIVIGLLLMVVWP